MAYQVFGSGRISTVEILAMIRQPESPTNVEPIKNFNISELVDKLLSFQDYVVKIIEFIQNLF